MLSLYQLENLTSLVNGDLVLLERKYRALPHWELWESLIDMSLVDCYEMVRDYCGISYEAWHTTNATNNLSLASEKRTTAANAKPSRSTSEISNTGSLLARMRRQVTVAPDKSIQGAYQAVEATFEKINIDKSSETTLLEMKNRGYSHLSSQPSRWVVIWPGNYTWLASVVDSYHYGVRSSINLSTPWKNPK